MRTWKFMGRDRKFSPLAIVGMVAGGAALAALFAFLFGWVVMLLWNWLMPEIFGLPRIGYWQGWGLVLLAHILVKPGYPGGHDGHDRRDKGRRDGWKAEARARFTEAGCGEPDGRRGGGDGAGGTGGDGIDGVGDEPGPAR